MTSDQNGNLKIQATPGSDMPLLDELDLLAELLPFQPERFELLELGCGLAAKTRAVAKRFAPVQVTAAEVDLKALAQNRAAQSSWEYADNIQFVDYGAQAIAKPDASVDAVLMFKSLHHVPAADLAQAMSEIRRVLKPGGLAYISEPVFAGELNEVIRLFHDEQQVRQLAFGAVCDAVGSGLLELVEQRFFRARVEFHNFDQFANAIIHATHSPHDLSTALLAQVEETFNRYASADGFVFDTPNRVDLLRRPS